MCESKRADASDPVSQAGACFEQIAQVIEESIRKAERLGEPEMVERLNAAKAAAERGSELTRKLAAMIELEHLHGGTLPSD